MVPVMAMRMISLHVGLLARKRVVVGEEGSPLLQSGTISVIVNNLG